MGSMWVSEEPCCLSGPRGSVWASKGPGCPSGPVRSMWPVKAGVVQMD